MQLLRVAGVEEQEGVEIAVPRMKHVPVGQPVALRDRPNAIEGLGKPGARHRAIRDEVVGRKPRDRPEGPPPACPEEVAFCRIPRLPNLPASLCRADPANPFHLGPEAGGRPVYLDDQDGGRVQRVAARVACLYGPHDRGVHHLQGGGNDPLGDDLGNGARRIRHPVVDGQQGHHRFREGEDPDRDLGHDPEGALASHEDAAQVVARRVKPLTSKAHDLPVGQHDLQAEDVVLRDTVLDAPRAA